MDLRDFLLAKGLKQSVVIKAANRLGYPLCRFQMSRIVNKKEVVGQVRREAIREALVELGFKRKDLAHITELTPR